MLPPEKHRLETLWGHAAARSLVPRLLAAGRLPHAILLTGPDAIGKRSLAFGMVKTILSAGRRTPSVVLNAPAPARAQRQVPPPEDDDAGDDLFGGAFGNADVAEGRSEQDTNDHGDASKNQPVSQHSAPSTQHSPFPIPHQPLPALDARVCRLVEASYPMEYDRDGRPTKAGHLDLTIIEPPGGRRSILVDQIRYLQEVAYVAPVEGAFRVALVLGADTITQEAGNSILKLLEEPPRYLVLILVANRLGRVLPTIRSRCSVVPMNPLDRATLVDHLVEDEKLDRSLANVAAALSEGRPGVALAVIEQALLQRRRDIFEARLYVDRFGVAAVSAAAARISATSKLDESLWLLMSFVRDRLVRALAPEHEGLLIHGDAGDLLDAKTARTDALDAEADRLVNSYDLLAHPYLPNPRAALELVLWGE